VRQASSAASKQGKGKLKHHPKPRERSNINHPLPQSKHFRKGHVLLT
jgi:hypothetical protein